MNMILSFRQVTCVTWRVWRVWRVWRDVTWCDVKNHNKKRPEWTILDAMGTRNNNHPQEWEDNIVIEK